MELNLNKFNEEEKNYLINKMSFLAMLGVNCSINNDEELMAWCERELANKKDKENKEAEKKAKKEAKEIEKANAMGLSLEEYKKEKNRQRNIKRVSKEIEELEKELAKKKEYLRKLEG